MNITNIVSEITFTIKLKYRITPISETLVKLVREPKIKHCKFAMEIFLSATQQGGKVSRELNLFYIVSHKQTVQCAEVRARVFQREIYHITLY